MVELVAEQSIILCQQSLKQTSVGVKAAGIENGVLPAMETRYLLLQLLVDILERRGGRAQPITTALVSVMSHCVTHIPS